jgi:hypothetical protein
LGGPVERQKSQDWSIKLGPPLVAANSYVLAQNSKINNAGDAIEAAAANLKNAGNATINPNILTAPAAWSSSNCPITTTTTFDVSLSLLALTIVAA